MNFTKLHFLIALSTILLFSCKKKEVIVPDNNALKYQNVSTVKLENYINRIYIDLLGREPLDSENDRDVLFLRNANLSFDARKQLITRLMTDTTYVVGDSSYKKAYYQRIYDLQKARFIEGASDADIEEAYGPLYFAVRSARLLGDSLTVYSALETIKIHEDLLRSKREYQLGKININEMCARMLNNSLYDLINMNSFNFVNASFDDLFFRFPSNAEFNIAFDIIETGKGGSLFNKFATNKNEYCFMLTQSNEFYEGMIKWAYIVLMGREPNTQETYNLMVDYNKTKNFQTVQTKILMTDEYAQF